MGKAYDPKNLKAGLVAENPAPLLGNSQRAMARLLDEEEIDRMVAEAAAQDGENEEDDDAGSE